MVWLLSRYLSSTKVFSTKVFLYKRRWTVSAVDSAVVERTDAHTARHATSTQTEDDETTDTRPTVGSASPQNGTLNTCATQKAASAMEIANGQRRGMIKAPGHCQVLVVTILPHQHAKGTHRLERGPHHLRSSSSKSSSKSAARCKRQESASSVRAARLL